MLKNIFLISLLLLLGCSNDKTFKGIFNKKDIGKLHTFELIATDTKLLKLSKDAAKEANIRIGKSPYTIVVESSKYPQHCNNPLTPAYEASYDGYVKITLKKAFSKIYFIQRDFHDDVDEGTIEDLFEIMKKDMKIN